MVRRVSSSAVSYNAGMNRFVTICFRGDDADNWASWPMLEQAEACVEGVNLCDIDRVHAEVFDLERNCLLIDEGDFDEEWHGPKAASATDAMSNLVDAYRVAKSVPPFQPPADAAGRREDPDHDPR
jgi:hypothetical protein